MFIIVCKRAIQNEKFGSNYTKHQTAERKYAKAIENCPEIEDYIQIPYSHD